MTNQQVAELMADLADFFGELDDGEARPFGEFARVDVADNVLTVRHEDDDNIGVRITVAPL